MYEIHYPIKTTPKRKSKKDQTLDDQILDLILNHFNSDSEIKQKLQSEYKNSRIEIMIINRIVNLKILDLYQYYKKNRKCNELLSLINL